MQLLDVGIAQRAASLAEPQGSAGLAVDGLQRQRLVLQRGPVMRVSVGHGGQGQGVGSGCDRGR